MSLFTIRFSTVMLSGDEVLKKQHTLTALPFLTAQSYKRFDDWSIEPYQPSNDERPARRADRDMGLRRGSFSKPSAATSPGKSSLHHAAATGDMAAAINAGAK